MATTTPGGTERTSALDDVVFVVDVGVPVDVSTVVPVASGAGDGAAVSEVAAGCVDAESVADDSTLDDVDSGGSAHATAHPNPVTTAAPTPKATANPPTRPAYAVALITGLYAHCRKCYGLWEIQS